METMGNSPERRKLGALLGYGILFLPIVFSWAVLSKGYSSTVRLLSFAWLAIFAVVAATNYAAVQGLAPAATANSPAQSATAGLAMTGPAAPLPVAPAATNPPKPIAQEPPRPVSKWSYSKTEDEMRGTKTRFARLVSDNVLQFGFPYGEQSITLILRDRPSDGLNVMLAGEAQFICSEYSRDYVAVKFDDGPVENYGCSEPASAASRTIFVNREQSFLAKLRKAKTVIIEAQFFDHGNEQIKFSVQNLDW